MTNTNMVSSEVESDSSFAMAEAIVKGEFPHTTDAQIWVKEWNKVISQNPTVPFDEGTMLAWFASAIMAGYDKASYDIVNTGKVL